jgi:hypothetical protein
MPPNGAQAGTHKRRSSLRGQCLRWVKGCFCGDVHGTGPLYRGLCVDAQTGIPLLPEVLICEIATLASPALSQCGAGIWILVLHLTMCGPATPHERGNASAPLCRMARPIANSWEPLTHQMVTWALQNLRRHERPPRRLQVAPALAVTAIYSAS